MKKLLHSLTGAILAAAAIAPQASAITVDQLLGNETSTWGIELMYGSNRQNSLPMSSHGVKVVKVDDSRIQLQGVYDGNFVVNITISGNTAILKDGAAGRGMQTKPNGEAGSFYNQIGAFYGMYLGNYNRTYYYSYEDTYGSISGNDEIGYQITFNSPLQFQIYNSSQTQILEKFVTSFYNIMIMRPNAEGTDNHPSKNSTQRKWLDRVTLTGNKLEFVNFSDNGNAIDNYYYYDGWGTRHIGGKLRKVYGEIQADGETVLFPDQQFLTDISGMDVIANPNLEFVTRYCITPISDRYHGNSVVGHLAPGYTPKHNEIDEYNHYWTAQDNGPRKTYETRELTIGDYKLTPDADDNYYVPGYFYNTKYTITLEATHSAAIDMHPNGYAVTPTIGTYVHGTVTPIENAQYVDHYELFITDDKNVSLASSQLHEDTGLASAKPVLAKYTWSDGKKIKALANEAVEDNSVLTIPAEGGSFKVMVPEDVVEATKGHSLFVKAVYNDAHNLHPTFHALTTLTKTTTGIEELELDSTAADISAVAGGIVVEGFEGNVEVYTAAGVQVYAGVADGTISVAPGLYIVKAGIRVEKLNVR